MGRRTPQVDGFDQPQRQRIVVELQSKGLLEPRREVVDGELFEIEYFHGFLYSLYSDTAAES